MLPPAGAGLAFAAMNWITGPSVEFVKGSLVVKLIVAVFVKGWVVVTVSVVLTMLAGPGSVTVSGESARGKLPVMSGIHVPGVLEDQENQPVRGCALKSSGELMIQFSVTFPG